MLPSIERTIACLLQAMRTNSMAQSGYLEYFDIAMNWPSMRRLSLTHEMATVILLALNGISAERRILFADFERRLVVRAVVPLVHCFEAIPDLNSDTLWRSP